MNDCKNSESGTRTVVKSAGYTATTKLCISVNGLSYDRSTANKILDSVKDGQSYHQNILTLALLATGDLQGEKNT